ncbi:MAG: DUF6152 family protein [Gammaproteobacteria bacterium]
MQKKLKGLLTIIGWLLFTSVGNTHHNFNAYYDVRGRVTVEGVITEVRMANPHSRITLEAQNDQGKTVVWAIETGAPRNMVNRGWTRDTLPVGSKVTALGFPASSGRPIMALIQFTFEGGREVRGNMDRYLRVSEVE